MNTPLCFSPRPVTNDCFRAAGLSPRDPVVARPEFRLSSPMSASSTPHLPNPTASTKRKRTAPSSTRAFLSVQFAIATVVALVPSGCKTAAFLFGSRSRDVKAQFKLCEGPILVFVDDINERVDWPAARRFLWDDITQELLRTKSASKIIPMATEDSLRQTVADFGKLSAREIGELAGADQVLWIEVQDFLADEQITEATNAAYFVVTAKVLNAKEKDSRTRVRLWPTSPDGHTLTADLTGGAVLREKTRDGISRALTAELAVETARLFHDHRLDES